MLICLNYFLGLPMLSYEELSKIYKRWGFEIKDNDDVYIPSDSDSNEG